MADWRGVCYQCFDKAALAGISLQVLLNFFTNAASNMLMIATGQNESLYLGSLLETSLIVSEMKSADRWQAIDELLDAIVAAGLVAPQNRDTVSNALKSRERMVSTGIGSGIGIPHVQTALADRVVAAFGRSRQGIDFEALDGEPVHLVILTLIPQGQFQQHLRTLATIARLLNDKSFRAELMQAPNAAAILKAIRRKNV